MFHDPVEDGFTPHVPVTDEEVKLAQRDLIGAYKGGGLVGVFEEFIGMDVRLEEDSRVLSCVERLVRVAGYARYGTDKELAIMNWLFPNGEME